MWREKPVAVGVIASPCAKGGNHVHTTLYYRGFRTFDAGVKNDSNYD
jgi:hypothetical protein